MLPQPIIVQQWRPLDPHIYKVNFNVAVFSSSNLAGIGVIACDCGDEVIGALSISFPLAHSVAVLEALASRRAVQFASEVGLTQVVFEGDSAVVINVHSHGTGELSSYGNIIEAIRVQASVFQFVDFTHVNHVCYSLADALAKKAISVLGFQVWLEDLPADIVSFVLRDVHQVSLLNKFPSEFT